MKPKKNMQGTPLQMPTSSVRALERVRVSYQGSVEQTLAMEADRVVQWVVEMTLRNVRDAQRTA